MHPAVLLCDTYFVYKTMHTIHEEETAHVMLQYLRFLPTMMNQNRACKRPLCVCIVCVKGSKGSSSSVQACPSQAHVPRPLSECTRMYSSLSYMVLVVVMYNLLLLSAEAVYEDNTKTLTGTSDNTSKQQLPVCVSSSAPKPQPQPTMGDAQSGCLRR